MLVTVSREDAARLLIDAVGYAVGRTGFVVEAVCDAAEQLLRALTIAEADEITAAIEPTGGDAEIRGTRADEDHWRRLSRQLLDRTLTGAPEQVPLIGRDLALLCVCAERQAGTLEPASREELRARIVRCRELLPADEQAAVAELVPAEPPSTGSVVLAGGTP